MLLFHGIIFPKLKCFIDILAKFFLQTYGSILLKRNITFFDFFKSTNLSIDRQTCMAAASLSYKAFEKVVKCGITTEGFQASRNHIKVSVYFSVWQLYVCLASYSLKNHSILKRGRGSVTFEFGQLKRNCKCRKQSLLPLPNLSGKIEGDSTRRVRVHSNLITLKLITGSLFFPLPRLLIVLFLLLLFLFSLCTTFKGCVFGGESKNGFLISDYMDSSLPKLKRKIKKRIIYLG